MTTTLPDCHDCGHPAEAHSTLSGCLAETDQGTLGAVRRYCTCNAYVKPPLAQPVTPYDGGTSSGHSGSDASHQRALTRDADGSTHRIQSEVLEMARETGAYGFTVAEAREVLAAHHGTVSGAMSSLHMKGHLARLVEKRNRCQVYVLPEYVKDRATAPHGRRPKGSKGSGPITLTPTEADALRRLASLAALRDPDREVTVRAGDLAAVSAALSTRSRA